MNFKTPILLVLSIALFCCGGPFSKNARLVGAPGTIVPAIDSEYRLHVGDKLAIKLFYNQDLNQEVAIRPDGKISLLLVHEVDAVNLTPSELTKLLTESYAKHLQQPEVSVIVNGFAAQRVFVGGEVAQPGVKEIVGPTSVIQAVFAAGGFKDSARLNEVIVLRRGEDDKPFHIALDAEKAMKGIDLSQDIYLQPYDMVLVPRSRIADINLWVTQYLRNNLGLGTDFALYYSAFAK